jgi:hypothetical protein
MAISNDKEFKAALNGLSVSQQRQVAALFVDSVLHLSGDGRVKGAVGAAKHLGISDAELAPACQAARSARVESYTQCGRETDWKSQAGHFVAKAALACVRPAEEGGNLAWEAAMDARMARTCESIALGEGTKNREAETQYRILYEFMNQ